MSDADRRRFDVALLDIDGTLLDSTYHHALAWARAFAAGGHPVPVWRLHRLIGMGGDRLVVRAVGEDVAGQIGEEVKERWEAAYDEMIASTRLFPGARELLDGLRSAGLEVVLASSSIPKHAQHALDLLDAGDRADAWTTSEDASESKPHPELLEAALERVGESGAPEGSPSGSHAESRAVMIGDAVWDVEAAARATIPTIGLRCGGFGAAELRDAGAIAVYDDPADLLAHLDEALAGS